MKYFEEALEHSKERNCRAREAFEQWKQAKDEMRKMARNKNNVNRSVVAPIEREKNFQAWLQRKNSEEKATKRTARSAEYQRSQEKQLREVRAHMEYEKWLETAKTKPKCVPMGRGLFSKHFIQPIDSMFLMNNV